MPLFAYTALYPSGKRFRGVVEAAHERDAKERLRERGLMVSALQPQKTTSSRHELKQEQLLNFTLQLSILVKAGVPIFQSLVALEEQSQGEKHHRILISLCDQIRSGSTLSAAMSAHPQSFPALYTSMIAAGESAGALEAILERLATFLAKTIHLRKQVVSAMIYPAVLSGFCVVVITLLLSFVVPSIQSLFEGRQVNTFTALVLSTSHFLTNYWWLYLPLLATGVFGLVFYLRTSAGKLMRQRIVLQTPLVKTLVVQAALARFCRTLSTLLQGGMNMIESMRLARKVLINVKLEEIISQAEEGIVQGKSLSQELKKQSLIPKLVVNMLAVGEESGDTTPMLQHIASLYEDELEKSLTRLTSIAQPVILLIMGGVVGIIMCAILLPLTEFNSMF
jgi:general secretion pathway protein F